MNRSFALVLGMILFGSGTWLPAQVPQVRFSHDLALTSRDGHAQLVWGDSLRNQGYRFELQQSTDANFTEVERLYTGPDFARYLSGLNNGSTYYRIRAIDPETEQTGPWSETVDLTVDHHPLSLALGLAGTGLVVFLLTVAVVVIGSYRTRKQASLG